MRARLLDVLRCPFCGTALAVVENHALRREGDEVLEGVLGCECCAYPVVDGIPVLIADDASREALRALEDGRRDDALRTLVGLERDPTRRARFDALLHRHELTYREALELLCDDAEATWALHRFTDPTFVTAEAVLAAVAQRGWPLGGRVLDVCGGTGHLTRVLEALRPDADPEHASTVLADVYFWKLWLAGRFVVPDAEFVCCDANSPLPFARGTFTAVLLADAFPYIWHKRLLADELMRVAGEDGVVIMPHLHSSLGENFSAGGTLTPAAYRTLFESHAPRLFSDARLFDEALERRVVDLTRDVFPEELGTEPSLTLVASRHVDVFRRYDVRVPRDVRGELIVNPLYRVEKCGSSSVLTLGFPTAEYEAEFSESLRYLPERLVVDADLTRPLTREALGARYGELRDRRVVLDAPVGYSR